MRNFHSVFQNDCTNLLPLRCAYVSCLHIFTLIIVIQMGVVWFAISGWLVMLSTFGHLNTFFRKMSAHVLYPFIIRSFFFSLIELWGYIFWILTPYLIYGLQIFSSIILYYIYIYVILFLLFLLQCRTFLVCSFHCLFCFCCLCFSCI